MMNTTYVLLFGKWSTFIEYSQNFLNEVFSLHAMLHGYGYGYGYRVRKFSKNWGTVWVCQYIYIYIFYKFHIIKIKIAFLKNKKFNYLFRLKEQIKELEYQY